MLGLVWKWEVQDGRTEIWLKLKKKRKALLLTRLEGQTQQKRCLSQGHTTTMKCHDPFFLCVTSVTLTMTPPDLLATLTHLLLRTAVAKLPSLMRISGQKPNPAPAGLPQSCPASCSRNPGLTQKCSANHGSFRVSPCLQVSQYDFVKLQAWA